MSEYYFFIILIFGLILLSAFFSITESSIFSLQRYQIDLIKKKSSIGNILEGFVKNPASIIATILLADEILNVTIISLLSSKLNNLFIGTISDELISIVTIFVASIIILIFCEIIPKTIGVKFSRKISIIVAPPVYFLNKVMFPLTLFFDGLSRFLIKLFSPTSSPSTPSHHDSVKNIPSLIDIGEDEGSVKKSESKIIDNLLKLEKINLVKILIPEPDLFLLPSTITNQEALIKIKNKGFSRIPVYDGDSDNIVGILHSKDLLTHESSEIYSILREPYFVPDKKNALELLRELQVMKRHMAIVIDEYGRLEGIVTLEDIIEEIFGEIEDEKDVSEAPMIFKNGVLYLDGGTRIGEFNEACLFGVLRYAGVNQISNEINRSFISEDLGIETMGGFVFNQLGRLPKKGEFILNGNLKLTVEEIKDNRITRISAERIIND
ncbi:MAG TPA: HlyC/CorC family transporter [Candidatus Dadabacteria bacterium]|nr:HlyC/CorC family transporter [Candidatus Dadabacteria bacterium]